MPAPSTSKYFAQTVSSSMTVPSQPPQLVNVISIQTFSSDPSKTSTPSFSLPRVVYFTPSPSSGNTPFLPKPTSTESSLASRSPTTAQIIMKNQLFPGNVINYNTQTLIISDSNLRQLTIDSDMKQIICIPDAKTHHIQLFLNNLSTHRHPKLSDIYILIGLNDRDNYFQLTQNNLRKLKTTLNSTAIHFILFQIHRPPGLSSNQIRNIDLCNAFFRDQFHTLPTDFMTFRPNDIHFAKDKMKLLF